MKRLAEEIRSIIVQREKNRRIATTLTAICGILVFITVYTLILPALALEQDVYCGKEAHEHSDACYEQVLKCGMEEHTHDKECYDDSGNLTCGMEEHSHNEACYQSKLVCGKERHIHNVSCYKNFASEEVTDAGTQTNDEKFGVSVSEEDKTDSSAKETTGKKEDKKTISDPDGAGKSAQNEEADPADEEEDTESKEEETVTMDISDYLTEDTGLWYYRPSEKANAAWKEVDKDTALRKKDLVCLHLALRFKKGTVKDTVSEAVYELPENIEITDVIAKWLNDDDHGMNQLILGNSTPDKTSKSKKYLAGKYEIAKNDDTGRWELTAQWDSYLISQNAKKPMDAWADMYVTAKALKPLEDGSNKVVFAEKTQNRREIASEYKEVEEEKQADRKGALAITLSDHMTGSTGMWYYRASDKEKASWNRVREGSTLKEKDLVCIHLAMKFKKGTVTEATYDTKYILPDNIEFTDVIANWHNNADRGMDQLILGTATPDNPSGSRTTGAGNYVISQNENTGRWTMAVNWNSAMISENAEKDVNVWADIYVTGKSLKPQEDGTCTVVFSTAGQDEKAVATTFAGVEKEEGASEEKTSPESDDQSDENNDVETTTEAAPADEVTTGTPETTTAAPADETSTEAAPETSTGSADDATTAEEEYAEGTLSYEGEDYTVTVSYGADARLPKKVKLDVREIKEDSGSKAEQKEYSDYFDQASEAIKNENKANVKSARFFDITFMDGQKEIEPSAPINVKIEYKKAEAIEDNQEVAAVHLPDKADNEVLTDVEVQKAGDGVKEVEFTAESFSVYGVVSYTVDYYVNGYEFHMPGSGTMKLSELFRQLKIEEDVHNVEKVDFTDETLLKITADWHLGFVGSYDWTIESLKPFTSWETLTITMKDGKVYEIDVTDAQNWTVAINLFDYDGSTPASNIGLDGKSYAIVALFTNISDGSIAGYKTTGVSLSGGNHVNCSIDISKFKSLEWVEESEYYKYWREGQEVDFDQGTYSFSIRLYEGDISADQWQYQPYSNIITNADHATGYEFLTQPNGNVVDSVNRTTTLNMKKAYDKEYHVHLNINKPGLEVAVDDQYYMLVTANHATSQTTYAYRQITVSPDQTLVDIPITTWYDNNGNALPNEKFTGNEDITVEIFTNNKKEDGTKDGFNDLNNLKSSQTKVRIKNGDPINKYNTYYKAGHGSQDDTANKKTYIYDVVQLSAPDGSINKGDIDSLFQDATDFGYYTEEYSGHSGDIEATIGAARLSAIFNQDFGYSSANVNTNKLKVLKTFTNADGSPVINKAVTIRLKKGDDVKELSGTTNEQGILEVEFEGLASGSYEISEVIGGHEISSNGKSTINGSDVTANFSMTTAAFTSNANINYFGTIEYNNNDDVEKMLQKSSRVDAIILTDTAAEVDRLNRVIDERRPNGKSTDNGLQAIQSGTNGYKQYDIVSDMVRLRQLSDNLAAADSSESLRIVNLRASEITENGLFFDDDGRYIVLNIIMDKEEFCPTVTLDGQRLLADYGQSGKANSSRVLYNLRSPQGGLFTGDVNTSKEGAGVILAPSANAHVLGGPFGGTIITKSVHREGNELHSNNPDKVQQLNATIQNIIGNPQTGSLEIRKSFSDPGIKDKSSYFSFEVALQNSDSSKVQNKTFTASGLKNGNTVTFDSEGKATILVKAGSSVTISNLPAGTTYTVNEVINASTSRFILDHYENKSGGRSNTGSISAGQTESVTAFNALSTGADVRFEARKSLIGESLTDGAYSFTLEEYDNNFQNRISTFEAQTKSNSASGTAVFDRISYDVTGEHYYLIKEVIPEDAVNTNGDVSRTREDGSVIHYDTKISKYHVQIIEENQVLVVHTFRIDDNVETLDEGLTHTASFTNWIEKETSIAFEKRWANGVTPDDYKVKVKLHQFINGVENTDYTNDSGVEAIVTSDNNWRKEWNNLPVTAKKNNQIVEYSYKITEEAVYSGDNTLDIKDQFIAAPSENGTVITNYPRYTELGVSKTWGLPDGTVIPQDLELTLTLKTRSREIVSANGTVHNNPSWSGYTVANSAATYIMKYDGTEGQNKYRLFVDGEFADKLSLDRYWLRDGAVYELDYMLEETAIHKVTIVDGNSTREDVTSQYSHQEVRVPESANERATAVNITNTKYEGPKTEIEVTKEWYLRKEDGTVEKTNAGAKKTFQLYRTTATSGVGSDINNDTNNQSNGNVTIVKNSGTHEFTLEGDLTVSPGDQVMISIDPDISSWGIDWQEGSTYRNGNDSLQNTAYWNNDTKILTIPENANSIIFGHWSGNKPDKTVKFQKLNNDSGISSGGTFTQDQMNGLITSGNAETYGQPFQLGADERYIDRKLPAEDGNGHAYTYFVVETDYTDNSYQGTITETGEGDNKHTVAQWTVKNFKDKTEDTSIEVEKRWKDADGNDVTDTQTTVESIIYDLYQTTETVTAPKPDTVNISGNVTYCYHNWSQQPKTARITGKTSGITKGSDIEVKVSYPSNSNHNKFSGLKINGTDISFEESKSYWVDGQKSYGVASISNIQNNIEITGELTTTDNSQEMLITVSVTKSGANTVPDEGSAVTSNPVKVGTVTLYKNSVSCALETSFHDKGIEVVKGDGNWTSVINNLPKAESSSTGTTTVTKNYKYYVTERTVAHTTGTPEYSTTAAVTPGDRITITNTVERELKSIYAKKVWKQGETSLTAWPDKQGTSDPRTVEFQLQYKNGENWEPVTKDGNNDDITTKEVNSLETVHWDNLPAKKTYRVVETKIDGRNLDSPVTAAGEGTESSPFVITNELEKKAFEFNKKWKNVTSLTTYDQWRDGYTIEVTVQRKTVADNTVDSSFKLTYLLTKTEGGNVTATLSKVGNTDPAEEQRNLYTATVTENGSEGTYSYNVRLPEILDVYKTDGSKWEYFASETVNQEGYGEAIYAMSNGNSKSVSDTDNTVAKDKEIIINVPVDSVELPETGGIGTGIFRFAGIMLIALAAALYGLKTIRREPGDEK